MTHRVLKSYSSKISVIHICSQKDRQYALPVITNLPMVPKCMSYHGAIGGLVKTGRTHCLSFFYIFFTFFTM